MGGSKKQTIGYRYFMSLMFGLGRGTINDCVEVMVGGLTAWADEIGGVEPPASVYISKADLFGGEKKEGGIRGTIRFFTGHATQLYPADIKSLIGGELPEFRGVATAFFDGMVGAMNPYPKEWKFRVRRHSAGWDQGVWNPAKVMVPLTGWEGTLPPLPSGPTTETCLQALARYIAGVRGTATKSRSVTSIHAMNGAHIVYEALTNGAWGGGEPRDTLDEASFSYAADILYGEAFGICLKWARKEEVGKFIQVVLDHIGGVLFTHRSTGLWNLKLIRGDYDADTLPLFNPETGLLSIMEDDTSSQDSAYNEIVVTFRDPVTNKDGTVRAQNPAAYMVQGGPVSRSVSYPGAPTKEIAGRIAVRDLNMQSQGLKKFKVRLDRRGNDIHPGSVFRVSDVKRGIAEIVLRAGEVDDGLLADGALTITCVEDLFSFPDTSLVTPEEPTWTPPIDVAVPPRSSRLIELGYRDMFLRTTPAERLAITPEEAHVGGMAVSPATTTLDFDLLTMPEGAAAYVNQGTGSFCGSAILAVAITRYQTEIILTIEQDFPEDIIGDAFMVENEVMRIDAWDPVTHIMTVARGCADTLPVPHAAEARGFMIDDDMLVDQTIYVEGETVYSKVLTRTQFDVLPEDYVTVPDEADIIGRYHRPYPPGNLRLDGLRMEDVPYEVVREAAVLTWANRNRVTNENVLVPYDAANIEPEAGQTLTVEAWNRDATVLLGTHTGITGTSWTYDNTAQGLDGSPANVRLRVYSERDGIRSWMYQEASFVLKIGYGYGYGLNYGGSDA